MLSWAERGCGLDLLEARNGFISSVVLCPHFTVLSLFGTGIFGQDGRAVCMGAGEGRTGTNINAAPNQS